MSTFTIVRTALWFALGVVLSVNGLSILTWGFWVVMALLAAIILIDDI